MLTSCDPQFPQKHLCRLGDESYACTNSSPDVHRNWAGSRMPQVTNAAPLLSMSRSSSPDLPVLLVRCDRPKVVSVLPSCYFHDVASG